MGPIPILEIARAYGLRPLLWLLSQLHWLAAILFDLRSSICHVRSVIHCVDGEGYKLYKLRVTSSISCVPGTLNPSGTG